MNQRLISVTQVPKGKVRRVITRSQKPSYGFIDIGGNRDVYFNELDQRSLKVTPEGIVWVMPGSFSMPETGAELSFIVENNIRGLRAIYWVSDQEYEIAFLEYNSPRFYRVMFDLGSQEPVEMWSGTNVGDPLLDVYWNSNPAIEVAKNSGNGHNRKWFEVKLGGAWYKVGDPRPHFVYG